MLVANRYKYTIAGTLASIGVYKWTTFYAGHCRHEAELDPPKMTGDAKFEVAQAIQRNTLESLPTFLTSLWLYTLTGGSDKTAGIASGTWAVSRLLFFFGYPERRGIGYMGSFLAEFYLYFGAACHYFNRTTELER